jgi:enoyl-CoA hydratase/carnithine racemase
VADSEVLRIDDEGAVRLLTLDRPEAKNAFNRAQYDGVRLAIDEAAADDSIAVCVITGAGDIFSAGQDIKALAGIKDNPDEVPPSVSAPRSCSTAIWCWCRTPPASSCRS